MGKPLHVHITPGGFSLLELLCVLGLLGICAGVGIPGIVQSLQAREAKGAAQSWQAAAAWAQTGVLWHGGSTELTLDGHDLSLDNTYGLAGGDLGGSAPDAPVESNVGRWRSGSGSHVTFGGLLASPDGGGSLYFGGGEVAYRVAVRPESGLTARSLTESAP
jgi:prepilin-type N-terminal cleavage/methylation domain-containing protein